jgi:hypothetical protein
LKSAPRAFFTLGGVKVFSICPKLLINAELHGPCIGPKAGERIASILGGQFATLGAIVPAFYYYPDINVLTLISNLGPNKKPIMLKVGAKFFWP